MTTPVLGARALNRALLTRQLLVTRSELTALEAVEHLVGLQSQAPNPPYLGLWTRLTAFEADDLASLITGRQVVRMALMRSTVHVVSARDGLALRPLLAEMLARMIKSQFGRQLAGLEPSDIAELGVRLVEERPLTFAELGAAMTRTWPGHDANALAQTVRSLVPLVQLPPRGLWGQSGPAVHTTVGSWLGPGRPDHLHSATIDDFVLRYLAAFGPASVMDMQKWSGLTRLKAAFTRLGPALRRYRHEGGAELFDLADAPIPDPDVEVPVRFLPEFDNILLSHAETSRIMAPEFKPRVFTVNGIIRATILVDGVVRGLWRVDRSGDAATLVIEPFTPLTAPDVAALTEEAVGLLRFAAPEARHDVRVQPAG